MQRSCQKSIEKYFFKSISFGFDKGLGGPIGKNCRENWLLSSLLSVDIVQWWGELFAPVRNCFEKVFPDGYGQTSDGIR